MSKDEIKYNNQVWYLKTYESLMIKAQSRCLNKSKLDYYTELHHILPKCLGGDDKRKNLVLLTAREHIIAHMLLSCVFPDNKKLVIAVTAMFLSGGSSDIYYKDKIENRQEAMKRISSRLVAKFREEAAKAKIGVKRTPEQIQHMKEAAARIRHKKLGKKQPRETVEKRRQKLLERLKKEDAKERQKYASNKGKKFSEEHRRRISESLKKIKHNKASEETKMKMSKSHYEQIKSIQENTVFK